MRHRGKRFFLLAVFLMVCTILASADDELCCTRSLVFLPMTMPPEQERDATFFLAGVVESFLFHTARPDSNTPDIFDCPLDITIRDHKMSRDAGTLMERIAKTMGAKPDPAAEKVIEENLDFEYVWRAELLLDRIEEIVPGEWVEGYAGEPTYETSYVRGDWTFKLQLVNVHFNEVVAEGSASWNGNAWGTGRHGETVHEEGWNAIRDLMRTVFSPLDDLIHDYERTPERCTITLPEEDVSVGETVDIMLSSITDAEGRASKSWQRLMVKVEKGEILNATRCMTDEEKVYAFLVGDGSVPIRYKAPSECDEDGGDLTDTITVYNTCDWGQEWVIPLDATGCSSGSVKIAEHSIDISCPQVLYLRYSLSGDGVGTVLGDTVEHWIAKDYHRMDQISIVPVFDGGAMVKTHCLTSTVVDMERERHYIIKHAKGEYVEYSLNYMGEALDELEEESEGFSTTVYNMFDFHFGLKVHDTGEEREIDGYSCRRYDASLDIGKLGKGTFEYWVTMDIDIGGFAFEEVQKYLVLGGMRQTDQYQFGDAMHEAAKIKGLMVRMKSQMTFSFDKPGAPPHTQIWHLEETKLMELEEGLFEVPEGYIRVEQ